MTDKTRQDQALLQAALGSIDAKYIESAMEPPRRAIRRRRGGLAVACLAAILVVGMTVRTLPMYLRYVGGAVFFDSEDAGGWLLPGAYEPSAPPLPWDESLYFKGEVAERSLRPGEAVELQLALGLKDEVLGQGSLRVSITAPDLEVAVTGDMEGKDTVVVEEPAAYTAEAPLELTVTLTPTWDKGSWAVGNIYVSVEFIPADKQAFLERMAQEPVFEYSYPNWEHSFFSEDGALELEYLGLSYAGNRVETRIDPTTTSCGDVWGRMLADHYGGFRLGGEAAANMYYEWLYRGRVSASVTSYMTADPTMVRYAYRSSNLRYECSAMVHAPQISLAYDRVITYWDSGEFNSEELKAAERELAELILDQMYQDGIITQEEYESEVANMHSAVVSASFIGFSGYTDSFLRVLHKYPNTHHD